jgi:hypothetical protein
VSESKSWAPQPAHWYVPGSKTSSYSPVNGGSVPLRRRTSYCSRVSSDRHSSSVFSIFGMARAYRPAARVDRFRGGWESIV